MNHFAEAIQHWPDVDAVDNYLINFSAEEVAGWHDNNEEIDMHVQDIQHMLNFSFEKSSEDIIIQATIMVAALKDKVAEREARITRVREEYKIDDKALIDVLTEARRAAGAAVTYSVSNSVRGADGKMTEETILVGAGVVNMLLTERDFIEGEKAQIEKLSIIIRNLKDLPDSAGKLRGHKLSFQELKFLGF